MAAYEKGEHSKSEENSPNGEKPLKKARYEWEVKGKHHLKEKSGNINTNNNIPSSSTVQEVKEHRCFLSVPTSDDIVLSDEEEWTDHNIDQAISNEIPVTLVSPKNQEYYLRRWQARRVARGFVDNTINTILETYMNQPSDFDASDLVENCENDGQVEDEGILMAIQSHGLQSNINQSTSTSKIFPEATMDNYTNYHHEISTSSRSFPSTEPTSCDNLQMEDPMDFLNAAVSAAIDKNGLSSYSF
ncbi:unnamed protein product [Brassicogethes aeneus]|uniref:Uncharacterized protein n=1 Tax=Brassicogethes aeneus TaxID=1431903 RepID=A0A9P0FGF4_BRAAE|nr:unnamed protein product [Brassicogethes aeneus]